MNTWVNINLANKSQLKIYVLEKLIKLWIKKIKKRIQTNSYPANY